MKFSRTIIYGAAVPLTLAGAVLSTTGAASASARPQQVKTVHLARAFLRDAPVLVLDEPAAGLDAAGYPHRYSVPVPDAPP